MQLVGPFLLLADVDSWRVRNPIPLLNDRTILRDWLHPGWQVDSAIVSGYSHAFTNEHAIVVAHFRLTNVLLGRDDYLHWRNSFSFVLFSLKIVKHLTWLFVDRSIIGIRSSVLSLVGYPSLYFDKLIVQSSAIIEHLLAHIYAVTDHPVSSAVI